ncbi:hypothetical protein KCU62_g86, partial [Aureobasidium sp. EXF-3399]
MANAPICSPTPRVPSEIVVFHAWHDGFVARGLRLRNRIGIPFPWMNPTTCIVICKGLCYAMDTFGEDPLFEGRWVSNRLRMSDGLACETDPDITRRT